MASWGERSSAVRPLSPPLACWFGDAVPARRTPGFRRMTPWILYPAEMWLHGAFRMCPLSIPNTGYFTGLLP